MKHEWQEKRRVYLVQNRVWVTFFEGHCLLYRAKFERDRGGSLWPATEVVGTFAYPDAEPEDVQDLFNFFTAIKQALDEWGETAEALQRAEGAPGSDASSDDKGELAVEIVIHPSDDVTAEYRHRAMVRSMRRHPSNRLRSVKDENESDGVQE